MLASLLVVFSSAASYKSHTIPTRWGDFSSADVHCLTGFKVWYIIIHFVVSIPVVPCLPVTKRWIHSYRINRTARVYHDTKQRVWGLNLCARCGSAIYWVAFKQTINELVTPSSSLSSHSLQVYIQACTLSQQHHEQHQMQWKIYPTSYPASVHLNELFL